MRILIILIVGTFFINNLYSSSTFSDSLLTLEVEQSFPEDEAIKALVNVDLSEVEASTNHLSFKSPMTAFHIYSGNNSSSFVNLNQWKNIYRDYYFSAVNEDERIENYEDIIDEAENLRTSNVNPILIFAAEYDKFSQEAWDDGTISFNDNGVIEIDDSSQTKLFEKETIMMSTPFDDYLEGSDQKFGINFEKLIFNNYDEIDYIEIDFDDGNGFKQFTSNMIYSVEYLIDGIKEIKTRVNFENGKSLISRSLILVDGAEYDPPTASKLDMENYYKASRNFNDFELTSTRDLNGVTRKLATGYVYLGCVNNVFDNPFVIIEGFDPSDDIKPTDRRYPLPDSKYDRETGECVRIGFTPGIIRRLEEHSVDENGMGLFQKLIKNGYDVVIVNFNMDQINSHHELLQQEASVEDLSNYFIDILNSINRLKYGNKKSKVMGVSMGGLIARIGLKKIENDINANHEVSHYFSIDSPHRGAYIHLATQAFIQHMHRKEFTRSSVIEPYEKLNNRLAKEMLVMYAGAGTKKYVLGEHSSEYWNDRSNEIDFIIHEDSHINNLNMNYRKSFSKFLKNTGYPSETINITLTNGSIVNKDQNINDQRNLLGTKVNGVHFDAEPFGGDANLEHFTRTLPDNTERNKQILNAITKSQNFEKLKNHRIRIDMKMRDRNVDFVFENLSGGHADIVGEIAEQYMSLIECEQNEGGGIEDFQPISNFIPTASSLDLRNPDFKLNNKYEHFNIDFKEALENEEVVSPFDQIYATDENTDHALATQNWGNNLSLEEITSKRSKLLSMINSLFYHTIQNIFIQSQTISKSDNYLTNNFIRVGRNIINSDYFIKHSKSNGDAIFEQGSDVLMEAAEDIKFKPGSHVKHGAKLHARIVPKKNMQCREFLLKDEVGRINENVPNIISVYPNPSSNSIRVTIPDEKYKTLEIFDQTGNVYMTMNLNRYEDSVEIDISELRNGVYYLNIISNAEIQNAKFVKID